MAANYLSEKRRPAVMNNVPVWEEAIGVDNVWIRSAILGTHTAVRHDFARVVRRIGMYDRVPGFHLANSPGLIGLESAIHEFVHQVHCTARDRFSDLTGRQSRDTDVIFEALFQDRKEIGGCAKSSSNKESLEIHVSK